MEPNVLLLSLQFNNNWMHPGESIFTGIKIIDYRNGRYQGLFNSQTQKRQGMGILIDDDMNIYCSQWDDGRMNGLTFIYLSNGHYFYGFWRNNQPHGNNIYRNKQFILIGSYHRGSNVGNTLAITDAINHMIVFDGQQIGSKDKKKELDLISSENILEISLFEDIIYHTAAKNDIKLNKNQVTLVNFLKNFTERHNQHLQFTNKNGTYYFGFKVGLGFKFTLQGKVNHRISMISIGSHESEWVTDFGVKFHQSRCIQEGNFSLKETITYNKFMERPRDKCLSIFQKNHKKALNFINQYFQFKSNLLISIESFLSSRLYPRHQQDLKVEFERRRLEKEKLEEISQQKMQIKMERDDPKKMAARFERYKFIPNVQQRLPNRSISRNRSYSNLNKKASKSSLSPFKKNNSKAIFDHKNEESIDFTQYREIQDQLSKFKKEVTCQRCKSKQKRSQDKINSKKSLQKSKSTNKLKKEKGNKEIKYLVNYRMPKGFEAKISEQKFQKNTSKSFSNLIKTPEPDGKQKIRIENQLKIRRQIHEKQMVRDARNLHANAVNYPANFSEFLALNTNKPSSSVNPLSISPSSRSFKFSNAHIESNYDYHVENEFNNDHRNISPYLPPTLLPSESLAAMNSIKNIEELSNRRDRILREFKALNTALLPQGKYERNQSYNDFSNPISKQPVLPNRERFDDVNKISEFNKKYRNYLHPQDPVIKKNNIENDLAHRYSDALNHEPYVASFSYSPARYENKIGAQASKTSNLSNESKDARKKRYEYFFEDAY